MYIELYIYICIHRSDYLGMISHRTTALKFDIIPSPLFSPWLGLQQLGGFGPAVRELSAEGHSHPTSWG